MRTGADRLYVAGDRLFEQDGSAVPFVPSPNQSDGREGKDGNGRNDGIEPRLLIVHYTASLMLRSTVGWFLNSRARVSAHVIVDRDGVIVQMVPLNRRAWHAGLSRWGDLENLNAHAIGLELVNAGALTRTDAGDWIDWAGHRIPEAEVIVASHQHESAERGWHAYTEVQLARALAVGRALHAACRFSEVLGHDDVSPHRKIDPGPAFPMRRFAARVLAGVDATGGDRDHERQSVPVGPDASAELSRGTRRRP